MRRGLSVFLLGALAAGGIAAGVLAPGGGASPEGASAISRVTVVASEFKFKLSKRSVPTGTVIFTVVNKGKLSHDFKIAGKKTRKLNPGQKATLRVTFKKKGRYVYICTLPGHVKLGMRGSFAVGVKPAVTTPGTTTNAPPTTQPPPPTGTVGSADTTVQVGMFEYRFDLSRTTVPSGQVTFVITNKGDEVHNFAITGVKAGALIAPGKSETWTVGLPAKAYTFVCDVPFHVDRGMIGSLNVTP